MEKWRGQQEVNQIKQKIITDFYKQLDQGPYTRYMKERYYLHYSQTGKGRSQIRLLGNTISQVENRDQIQDQCEKLQIMRRYNNYQLFTNKETRICTNWTQSVFFNKKIGLLARKAYLSIMIDFELMAESKNFRNDEQLKEELQKDILKNIKDLIKQFTEARTFHDQISIYKNIRTAFNQGVLAKKDYELLCAIRERMTKIYNHLLKMQKDKDYSYKKIAMFCKYLNDLEGQVLRTSAYMLYELEHYKVIKYLRCNMDEDEQKFMYDRMQQINQVTMLQMEISFYRGKQLRCDMHFYRVIEQKQLYRRLFKSVSNWIEQPKKKYLLSVIRGGDAHGAETVTLKTLRIWLFEQKEWLYDLGITVTQPIVTEKESVLSVEIMME